MSSPKRKRTPKIVDSKRMTEVHLKQEIRKCEKKLEKLLDRYNNQVKRKTRNTKSKQLFQGIRPEGERHKNLQSYIDRLKTQLSQLGPFQVTQILAKQTKGKKTK